jgi:epoxyqueuosine reductase
MSRKEWLEITEDVFRNVFKNSAVKRAKYNGLLRNLKFLEEDY